MKKLIDPYLAVVHEKVLERSKLTNSFSNAGVKSH